MRFKWMIVTRLSALGGADIVRRSPRPLIQGAFPEGSVEGPIRQVLSLQAR